MIVFNELYLHGNFHNTKFDYNDACMITSATIDGNDYNCRVGSWSVFIPKLEIKIPWVCNGNICRALDRRGKLNMYRYNRNTRGFNEHTKKSIGNEYALFKFLSDYKITPSVGDTVFIKTIVSEFNYGFVRYDSTGAYGFEIKNANNLPEGSWNLNLEEFTDRFISDIYWSRFSIKDIFKEKNRINGYLIDIRSRYCIKLKHVDGLSVFKEYFNYVEDVDSLKDRITKLSQFPYKRRKTNYQSYLLDDEYQKGSRDTLYRFDIMGIQHNLEGCKVLDLGCNLGSVCIESYRRGALAVLGLDKEKDYIDCARDLSRYNGFHIDYVNFDLKDNEDVVDYIKKYFKNGKIDIIFALSLYKHVGESMFKILNDLSWKVCYVESHSAKKGLETKHVREMISHMNNIKDANVEYVGTTSDRSNRIVWKITR